MSTFLTSFVALTVALSSSAQAEPAVAPASPATPAPAPRKSRIEFVIRTKHGKGPVRCALYDHKDHWLSRRYVFKDTAQVYRRLAICIFEDVPPGTYGATAYHDKNDNSKLDKNFLGIPNEDFTFSSGARAGLGPPSFEDADFSYVGGGLRITGRM